MSGFEIMAGLNTNTPTPIDVTARIAASRWDLLRTLSDEQLENTFIAFVIKYCSIIGFNTNNKLLLYRLQAIKNSESPVRKVELLKKLVNKLSPYEFNALLSLCIDPNNSELKPVKRHVLDKRKLKKNNIVLDNYILNLNDLTQNTEELTGVGSEAAGEIGGNIHTHRNAPSHGETPSLFTELLTPFTLLIGIFQAGYDSALNSAFLRNAFDEYQSEIKNIDYKTVNKIVQRFENDPDAQIEAIKQIAKERIRWSLFARTVYAGSLYSVTFAVVLAIFFPATIAIAVVGIVISTIAAFMNSYFLGQKIDRFKDQPVLDELVFSLISSSINMSKKQAPKIRKHSLSDWINIPAINRVATYVVRFVSLITTAALSVLPFVSGIIAAINSMFSWEPLRSYIKTLHENKIRTLHKNLHIDTEVPSFWSYYGSNLMRTYLLNVKSIESIEHDLAGIDAVHQPEGRLMRTLRAILSPIGLLNSSRVHAVLETLYDGNNPRALRLLDKYRVEAKRYQLDYNINKYFQKNKQRLAITKSLQDVRQDHIQGNSHDFYHVMHNYLQDTAVRDAKLSIIITGITSGLSWGLLVCGIGLTFFAPIAPIFAFAALGIVATSAIATYVIAVKEENRLREALVDGVTRKEFVEEFNRLQLPEIDSYANNKFYDAGLDPSEHAENSFSRLIHTFKSTTPKRTLSMHDKLLELHTNISKPEVKKYIKSSFELQVNSNSSIDVQLITNNDTNTKTLLSAPPNIDERFNLHEGKQQSWQLLMAFMTENDSRDCSFSLGNIDIDDRAQQFVEAMILEFISHSTLRCKIEFNIEDFDSAYAIYKVLKQPELITNDRHLFYSKDILDKVRAHFGLVLVKNQIHSIHDIDEGIAHPYIAEYTQNIGLFSTYLEQIAAKDNIPLIKPYKNSYARNISYTSALHSEKSEHPVQYNPKPTFWEKMTGLARKQYKSITKYIAGEDLISLEGSKLHTADEFRKIIMQSFELRLIAIEKQAQIATSTNNAVLQAEVKLAIKNLKADFEQLAAISKDVGTEATPSATKAYNRSLSKAVLQYCQRRQSLEKAEDMQTWPKKNFRPSKNEAASVRKLIRAANRLLAKDRPI